MSLDQINVVQNPQSVNFTLNSPVVQPGNYSTSFLGGNVKMFPQVNAAAIYDPVSNSFSLSKAQASPWLYQYLDVSGTVVLSASSLQSLYTQVVAKVGESYLSGMGVSNYAQFQAVFADQQTLRNSDLVQQIADLNALYRKTQLPSLKVGLISLDPDQFVQMSDQLRKLLWREIP